VIYDWDEAKRWSNIEKHGIDFFELRDAFHDQNGQYYRDERRDHGEIRCVLLASWKDKIVHIVFTDRGDYRRIISARQAHWKERVLYERGTDRKGS